jgi:hypothetical protein
MKWRNDFNPKDQPTARTIVTTASDEVQKKGPFTLSISHVKSFRGNGFMPSITYPGRYLRNGSVHNGEDQEAYARAVWEGQEHLRLDEIWLEKEEERGKSTYKN